MLFEVSSASPAEVVVAQPQAAGVRFPGREPPTPQGRGVPVDALGPRVADAPGAAVALPPARHALLVRVCERKRTRGQTIPTGKNNQGGILIAHRSVYYPLKRFSFFFFVMHFVVFGDGQP